MGLLSGKKALIVGLASNRSIAYGIAKAFHEQGAELAFTYQTEKLKGRVEKMAAEFGSDITIECDVAKDEHIAGVFETLAQHWDGLDILVHSVGFAPASQISGDFVDNIERDGFKIAHDISVYSFAALAKAAKPMMEGRNARLLTLTYLGSQKAVPNYNVMGLAKASLEASVRYMAASLGPIGHRVNAVSAGPIRTLAASGIEGFRKMLSENAKVTPLRENVTIEQVGNAAMFLCSDLSSGITGECLHVDAGFHAISVTPDHTS